MGFSRGGFGWAAIFFPLARKSILAARSCDLQHIFESKHAHRRNLAALAVAEKMRMLEAMRERELEICGRGNPVDADSNIVREDTAPYRISK